MKTYISRIIKWTFFGLAIRLILMPITMHGQDSLFINYFPMMCVTKGIWDPYGFIRSTFPHYTYTYYGPALFIIMSAADFLWIKLFNVTSLVRMLEPAGPMMFGNYATADFIRLFAGTGILKNLFLMKMPYLVFDFLAGLILLKLAYSEKEALQSYRLWMLNIVVLQSVYAVGGFDIIPAFFVIAALYFAVRKKHYLSVVFLSLGGATKLFAYLLILPTCLLLGNSWKKRGLLLFTAFIVTALIYLPFYLSSGIAFLGFFSLSEAVHYSGAARLVLTGIFAILYSAVLLQALKDSQSPNAEKSLVYYLVIMLFLSYAAVPVRFRYFVWVTPLLALIIPRHKKFGVLVLLIISSLAFSWLTSRDLQLGLFAPLDPGYFMSLPTAQEIIGRFINIEICYKIIARVQPLVLLTAAWWVWRIKSKEKSRFSSSA